MKTSNIVGSIAIVTLAFTSQAHADGSKQGQQTSQQHGQQDDQQRGQRDNQQQDQTSNSDQRGARAGDRSAGQDDARSNASVQEQRSGLAQLSQAQVEALQHRLQQSGHYQGEVDGIAGPMTQSALKRFQEEREIAGKGQLDEATMSALGLSFERQPVSGAEEGEPQRGMASEDGQLNRAGASDEQPLNLTALSPEQVQQLQSQLQAERFYLGKIDGVVGNETRSALRRFFQRQSQLAAQGKVSGSALSAFGLSPSEIQPVRGTDEPQRDRQRSTSERQEP